MRTDWRRCGLAALLLLVMVGALASAQERSFEPVTDAMLQDPDPADWLSWRRTLDGWGYSPLDQINTENVHQLQLVWAWQLGPGNSQPTPLVHDGVMFIPNTGNSVQAVDAVTGDRLWQYRQERAERPGRDANATPSLGSRSMAIYGDKVYLSTTNAHIVALDARTGEVAWDQTVADRWGNVAAITTTLNSGYGLAAVATGAGFLWNNEMDNFSVRPGVPSQYGLLGAEANSVQPGKRPLSSMTPTFVRRFGDFYMTMGSPGGPTIINTVLQIYLNVTVWDMDIQQAIDAPRIHHQWLPDRIEHEPFAISAETKAELERMGYELNERRSIGMAAGIRKTPEGFLAGYADRRGAGTARGY